MNKPLSIILVIVAIVVLFVVGMFVGINYQTQKTSAQIKQAQVALDLVKKLNSKVVSSVIVYGNVAKISGSLVTLNFGKETMEFDIPDSAKISIFKSTAKAGLKDIEKGQRLNMITNVTPAGELVIKSIVIYPVTPK